MIKLIASYLKNRTANIRINKHIGPSFNLNCGVPQGGCLSPSLFNYYNHDIPDPINLYSENIIYADDITQIISQKSQRVLTKQTEREIKNINEYERKWKINTNMKKFQVIPMDGKRTNKVKVNGEDIEYSNRGIALGTVITTKGFTAHATTRTAIAKTTLTNLFSLRNLSKENKKLLYMTMTRSKLIYSIIPLQTSSYSNKKKMQIIQNKAARLITNTRLIERKTNQQVNEEADLQPINIIIQERAKTIWDKITLTGNQRIKLMYNRNNQPKRHPSSRELCEKRIEPIY